MKTLMLAAALVLTTAASLAPASAAQPQPSVSNAAPHYEWQYHYVGRHARYVGHWVLVR